MQVVFDWIDFFDLISEYSPECDSVYVICFSVFWHKQKQEIGIIFGAFDGALEQILKIRKKYFYIVL